MKNRMLTALAVLAVVAISQPAFASKIVSKIATPAPAIAAPMPKIIGPVPACSLFEIGNIVPGGTLTGVFRIGTFSEIKTFALPNPNRYVVDVIGARITEKKFEMTIGTSGVRSVRAAQFSLDPDIVRIVFDLEDSGAIDVQPDVAGRKIVVREVVAKKVNLLPAPEISRLGDRVIIDLRPAKKADVRITQLSYPPTVVVEIPGVRTDFVVKRFPVHEGIVSLVTMRRLPTGGVRVAVSAHLPARYETEWKDDGRLRISIIQPALYGRTIVVDPGHGGKDPGATALSGLQEKDLNLDISRRLARLLRGAGARVIMTRSTDVFIPLDERAAIANRNKADVFVAIHINAMPRDRESTRGIQTFYFDETKRSVADNVMKSMSEAIGTGDSGVYSRRYLVLRKSSMPSVLCEIGFITNAADRMLMNDARFRENAARGILNGLETYAGGRGLSISPLPLPSQLVALVPYKPVMFANGTPTPTTSVAPTTDDEPELFESPDDDLIGVVRQLPDDDTTEDELLCPGTARPVSGSTAPAPQPFLKTAPTIIGE